MGDTKTGNGYSDEDHDSYVEHLRKKYIIDQVSYILNLKGCIPHVIKSIF